MDKIEKALHKLNDKDRAALKKILQKILANDFLGVDIKKLKGSSNIYRVRKGAMRVIYQVRSDRTINILTIERRSDTTYNHF